LVVVEISLDSGLVEQAREQRFDLLTGDASRAATLDLCNLGAAQALVALTNVDTLNLEIALGGRARNPTIPVVLRIAEASFAQSIARDSCFCRAIAVRRIAWASDVCRSGVRRRRVPYHRGWPADRTARCDPDRVLARGRFRDRS
jgi:hypothetical protein